MGVLSRMQVYVTVLLVKFEGIRKLHEEDKSHTP